MKNNSLTKQDVEELTTLIQQLYLEDDIPWVVGYSGGKDSTASLQLVWYAIKQLIEEKPHLKESSKPIYVISTDTLVESPVVAAWVNLSLERMRQAALKHSLPIQVHRLTPSINNTFWVNLIGRGYPYPRPTFRWCTSRLKIEPSNRFIREVVANYGEAIVVLGTRKAESSNRARVMKRYENERVRNYLSPNASLPNSLVFSPIENWSNDDVWMYLMQYRNPWGHSNKDLLSMYRGATADGECPLVVDSNTPSCGSSRFGCWVCTLVEKDKSMAAMIQNDKEKEWMTPLLEFRDDIGNAEKDRIRRDFRRKDGRLLLHNDRLVHGPYTKEWREYFLRRLLEIQKEINKNGPEEFNNLKLITHEELKEIRKIWLFDKHEFDDSLPKIYFEVTGEKFVADDFLALGPFGEEEWNLLKDVCISKSKELCKEKNYEICKKACINNSSEQIPVRLGETTQNINDFCKETCPNLFPGLPVAVSNQLCIDFNLLFRLQASLLDVEQRSTMLAMKRGLLDNLKEQIRHYYYWNEAQAETITKLKKPEDKKKKEAVKFRENNKEQSLTSEQLRAKRSEKNKEEITKLQMILENLSSVEEI